MKKKKLKKNAKKRLQFISVEQTNNRAKNKIDPGRKTFARIDKKIHDKTISDQKPKTNITKCMSYINRTK